MGKSPLLIILAILLVAACVPSQPDQKGPLLVKEITLPPTTPVATRILSPTPEPIVPIRSTSSELISPLEMVTVEADFVLVTPTLPPSKTPTETPTITRTASPPPTPTVTVTATATAPLFPTSIINPVTAAVANPLAEVCDSTWFFLQPRPAGCPLSAPLASQGVFQQFQNGYMVWVQSQEAIYVMYNDLNHPRWQVFKDNFVEGGVEDDPAYAVSPYPDTWQPRRGFGLLWRANMDVRERIGWAAERFEHPYSVQTQTAPDGVIFISDPLDGLFSLTPNGRNWQRFTGYEGF